MKVPPVRAAAPAALVATVFLVTVELLRATSPLLDLAAGDLGVVGAAQLAMAIFAAPALVGLARAATGPVRALLFATGLLVLLRLVAQLQNPATLLVVGAGAATGIAVLLLAVRHAAAAGSPVAATVGVLAGTVADLTIRTGYGSWDSIFRPGLGAWLLTLGVLAATSGAAVLVGRWAAWPARPPAAERIAVLGPYLALYVMLYGSAPILAAHAGVSLPVASAVLIATAVIGMELVRRLRLPGGSGAIPEPDRWFAGAAAWCGLVAGVAAGYLLTGPVALAGFVLAGWAAAALLARALTPPEGEAHPRRPSLGYAGAGLAAGLGYVLPVMVYQVHFDLEFPFDNRAVLLLAAAVLGLAGLGARPGPGRVAEAGPAPAGRESGPAPAAPEAGSAPASTGRPGWRSAVPALVSVLAAAALLVPVTVAVTRPAPPPPEQTGATVRLMSWNVMYGRHHTRGEVDLESVAATVEAVAPDVLLLQEVSRGWPIGGGVDMAEWLSRRLDLPYHWAPAADGLFGNLLLTRLPVSDVEAHRLPFLQGPMERSYVAATVTLADGQQLRVKNTHLQHRKGNTATRLAQSEALLAAWDGAPHTIIAGDFNFWPTWEEAQLWAEAGFISAQDVTGHGAAFTTPSDAPDNRVDWIFGTPDLTFSDFAILADATNSDHLPLVVTVTPAVA